MMGFSNNNDLNTSDSFNGRKLRPLIPRPNITATATTPSSTPSSYSTRIHGNDFSSLRDHLGATEQSKRQLSAHSVSSRWNPTPEQLQALEDLYRCGTHTPTAEQIRNITAQLRRFGKIEGKNVFYWFQNHKARERQKRRRQTEEVASMGECNVETLERKASGPSGKGFQVEGYKNWSSPTNYSIHVEESPSMYRAESRRRDEWLPYDPEIQLQSSPELNATWHVGNLSSSPHLIKNTNSISNFNPSITTAVTTVLSKQKILINENFDSGDDDRGRAQTLELFPIHSEESILEEKTRAPATPSAMNFTPYRFYEFL